MMMIINVFAARVCRGGGVGASDGAVGGQTDRCVGMPCPPLRPLLSGCIMGPAPSYPSTLGRGWAACGLPFIPQPRWDGDEPGGDGTKAPGSKALGPAC